MPGMALLARDGKLRRPGRPVNKRSPFFIGMMAAAGVAVTYGAVELVIRARSVLVLIGLALFIAIGLDPVVAWLTRRRMPLGRCHDDSAGRGRDRGRVCDGGDPAIARTSQGAGRAVSALRAGAGKPQLRRGQAERTVHVQEQLTHLLSSRGNSLMGGVVGAGEFVLSAASSAVVVMVLVIYFLADRPDSRRCDGSLAGHVRTVRRGRGHQDPGGRCVQTAVQRSGGRGGLHPGRPGVADEDGGQGTTDDAEPGGDE